jgi:hypothetical protein
VDTYRTFLFLHLVSLAVGLGAGAVLLTSLIKLRGASTTTDAAVWASLVGQIEKAFPVAIVGLFLTGAYMASDVWTWSTGWIDVGIAALVLLALQGPLLGGRVSSRLRAALRDAAPGPLDAATSRLARHPLLWLSELANIGVVFGVIWNMTQKPGTVESIAAVAVGYAVGAALGLRFADRSEPLAQARSVA